MKQLAAPDMHGYEAGRPQLTGGAAAAVIVREGTATWVTSQHRDFPPLRNPVGTRAKPSALPRTLLSAPVYVLYEGGHTGQVKYLDTTAGGSGRGRERDAGVAVRWSAGRAGWTGSPSSRLGTRTGAAAPRARGSWPNRAFGRDRIASALNQYRISVD